jgi:hypothetical protein
MSVELQVRQVLQHTSGEDAGADIQHIMVRSSTLFAAGLAVRPSQISDYESSPDHTSMNSEVT